MHPITVTELNTLAKALLASSPHLNEVWVSGEISNLTKHSSGHYYFTLKDEESEIRCTLFKYSRSRLKFEPELNMKVLALGSMDVFIRKGSYQFNIQDMKPSGVGDLHLAYEALKAKLEKEGLFDLERKRPIPRYPRCIGVVTSPTGAAVRDILNVTERRFPADILIAPALVQGEDAAPSIVKAIQILNEAKVDVIIVGRGGGSLEDLWPFNEEIVARAIFASKVPIISAVGHETDFCISDLVADLRAPTPSAAAEIVLPDRVDESRHLTDIISSAEKSLLKVVERMSSRFQIWDAKLAPKRAREAVYHLNMQLDDVANRLDIYMMRKLERQNHRLQSLGASMDGLNPLEVLSRGYCVLQSSNGATLTSVQQVQKGDAVRMVLQDGVLKASVVDKE